MLDEEINLNPSGPTSKATQSPSGNATSTAKALLRNQKFYCSRIKAEVSPLNCKGKYHYAKAQGVTASPCLECAKVLAMLRKEPVATYPEPQPTIDPKELATMSRPAKKGTPDQIQQEAKTEPKLEIVSKPAPEVKEKAGTLTNPFAGWDAYDKTGVLRGKLDMFVSFTKDGLMTVSVGAQEAFGIMGYKSVDVYHRDEKLGLALHKDTSGVLAVVARAKSKSSATISARGLIKKFKLDGKLGKRFAVREIAPGFVEIDLKSEVAA